MLDDVQRVSFITHFGANRADHLVYCFITVYGTELFYNDRLGQGCLGEVIAHQVANHDVLSTFLKVLREFGLQSLVFFVVT